MSATSGSYLSQERACLSRRPPQRPPPPGSACGELVLAPGLVWIAHIGFDRLLGHGLKYGSGFGATHLGEVGQRDAW